MYKRGKCHVHYSSLLGGYYYQIERGGEDCIREGIYIKKVIKGIEGLKGGKENNETYCTSVL